MRIWKGKTMKIKSGFTVIEVIIVIVIILLLAAIVFPSFMVARNRGILMNAGYTAEEAISIAKSNSVVVAEAIKRKKSRSISPSVDNGWNARTVETYNPSHGGISLPAGASLAVEGGKWYTFTWAGSKWMALVEGGTNIVSLFIYDGNKLTQMPGFGK